MAGTIGQNVGPSIASIGSKTPAELLVSILDPNREVDPRYLNYQVTLTDERTTSGIITAESPTAITLKRADGQGETVLRARSRTPLDQAVADAGRAGGEDQADGDGRTCSRSCCRRCYQSRRLAPRVAAAPGTMTLPHKGYASSLAERVTYIVGDSLRESRHLGSLP